MAAVINWDNTYTREQKVWGENPSELALMTHQFLKESLRFKNAADIFILDLGCGYGRDAIYLAQNLPCHILGLDNSEKAIQMAREALPKELEKRVELLCYDFTHVSDKYDVIFVANLYHLLKIGERACLRETIKRCLKSGGVLFLNTYSVKDPQHFGKGAPVEGESNSFVENRYIHLSTREELEGDFGFLQIQALYEREFREKRTSGDHQHVGWILMAQNV